MDLKYFIHLPDLRTNIIYQMYNNFKQLSDLNYNNLLYNILKAIYIIKYYNNIVIILIQ